MQDVVGDHEALAHVEGRARRTHGERGAILVLIIIIVFILPFCLFIVIGRSHWV